MHRVGTLKAIYRYPVKSMAGEELSSAELGWHGIEGDRRFAFLRDGDVRGVPWLTASTMPGLIRYAAFHTDSGNVGSPAVRVRMPDGTEVDAESEALRRHVGSAYGEELRLLRLKNGIFDDAPISLISTTTIQMLEQEIGCRLDIRRFRPNLLVEPTNGAPVLEETWIGKTLVLGREGEAPILRVTVRDIRCVMVNLDPETAAAEPRIFQTIARSHLNCAGVYATPMRVGTLSAGLPLYLQEA